MALSLKFYGTRGSIMSVSPERHLYGGHTPCAVVQDGEDMVIIDAGFGIANLGSELMATQDLIREDHEFHLFLTHFHWDHIQGLQYFTPVYFKGNRINVYSPFKVEVAREVLNLLLDGSYTPFNGLSSLPCEWVFHRLTKDVAVGNFTVSHRPTAHVDECYAYTVESTDRRMTFIADHDAQKSKVNDDLTAWAKGSGLLVHEAMYTEEEYKQFQNFGHSSFNMALENAKKIGAARTLFYHHFTLRQDAELAEHENRLQQAYNTKDRSLCFARENILYEVPKAG